MENFNPLVSVVIVTYNSSKYVEETLYSVINQTYNNIEIIVTDDCSTDNTIEICKKFFIKNKFEIKRVKILSTPKNSGISVNCNNGVKAAKGEWIKVIAGDDIMDEKCIETLIEYIKTINYKNPQIIFTKMKLFKNDIRLPEMIKPLSETHPFYQLSSTVENQLYYLIHQGIRPYGASSLYAKKLLEIIGYFDEKYRYLEDLPIFYKSLINGYKIFYLNQVTIYYRVHQDSITNRTDSLHSKYSKDYTNFIKDNFIKYYPLKTRLKFFIKYIFIKIKESFSFDNK